MNPTHLRSFISIADHGSFSKAAKALHISTQALLQQMQILERDVGAPLFYRTHQGVTKTTAGEYLYEGAKHILSYSETLLKRCQETLSEGNELRIGTSHEITPTFLYQIAFEYKNTHPKIALNIVYSDSSRKLADVIDSKIDLCESFNINTIKQYGLEFFPVLDAQVYCIVSKNHPLAKKDVVYAADLAGQTMLLSTSQTDCFGNSQLAVPENGAIYKRYHTLESKKLETALGHAVYFDYLLDPIDTDTFVAIPHIADKHVFGFVYRPNPSPAIKKFFEIAEKYRDIRRYTGRFAPVE